MTEDLKSQILRLAREFSALAHRANLPGWDAAHAPFEPGVTTVPYAGRVFDDDEVAAAIGATLDFWLTLGKEGEASRRDWPRSWASRVDPVNSGSSANLLAVSALSSPKLGDRASCPATKSSPSPPVFPPPSRPFCRTASSRSSLTTIRLTLNARVDQLEEAYVPGKTKAVMMAHTLGNPFDLARIAGFCRKHDLWLIEDNCDALGSTYTFSAGTRSRSASASRSPRRPAGRLSHRHLRRSLDAIVLSAASLDPGRRRRGQHRARHALKVIVESFRDWGRDCWCASGMDNTCGKRFDWQLGELPEATTTNTSTRTSATT